MSVITGTGKIQYVILPITIQPNFECYVNVAKNLLVDGTEETIAINTFQVTIPPDDTLAILSGMPDPSKNRWHDLASAVYGYLMDKGHIT